MSYYPRLIRHILQMSNGVQQTEVKLNTQTTQFKPVENYRQSDQVTLVFPLRIPRKIMLYTLKI